MPAIRNDWTVEELHELPDDGNRYELVDGVLLVSPTPSGRHQIAVFLLAQLIQDWLEQHPIGVAGVAPREFTFSRHRVLRPDVHVICTVAHRASLQLGRTLPLLLVAEVLSPSTARNDRTVKREAFQDERIPEYWIVDLDAEVVERWRASESRPEVLADRIEWAPSPSHPPFELELPEYFRKVQARAEATVID